VVHQCRGQAGGQGQDDAGAAGGSGFGVLQGGQDGDQAVPVLGRDAGQGGVGQPGQGGRVEVFPLLWTPD
jgi:hypothetical protein